MTGDKPINIFVSYSRLDRAQVEVLEDYLSHLSRSGRIHLWYDRELLPGERWNAIIKDQLDTSDVVLLVITGNFKASRYIRELELPRALELSSKRRAVVIPVVFEHGVSLNELQLHELQALPDGLPVELWEDRTEALKNVADGVTKVIRRICYEIDFTSPESDATVGRTGLASGTAELPDRVFLWVLAHREGWRKWWPQGDGPLKLVNKTWSVTVHYGEERDVGYAFEIAAAVFDRRGNKTLLEWCRKADQTQRFFPLSLPPTLCPIVTRRVIKATHSTSFKAGV